MKSNIFISLSVSLLVAVFVSCDDWLNVSSNSEIISEQQFSDESGFKDALIGVYIKMAKPELYAKELTWHTIEFLSQQYAVVAGAPDLNVPKYLYVSEPLKGYTANIWLNSYNLIANINNILRYETKNGNVMHPVLDSIVRGELLALRAMMHFDLLRMYGKGNLAGRPGVMSEYTIPYVTEFKKNPTEQLTYAETFKLFRKDMEEAIRYLAADPIRGIHPDSYYSQVITGDFINLNKVVRKMRMNYFSTKALYARILMWEGSYESKMKALDIAEELIETCFEAGAVNWATSGAVNGAEPYLSDLQFINEHLFTLNVEKLLDVQGTWLQAHSPNNMYSVVFLTQSRVEQVYEVPGIGDADWRKTKCLLPEGAGLNNYAMVKLRQHKDQSALYNKRLPMIRITEMYYIAAECLLEPGERQDLAKATEYLDLVRTHRNIPAAENLSIKMLSISEIKAEITKEYMKEFVGEGQLFFYYKRIGAAYILGRVDAMSDAEYVFPYPDDEMTNANRK